MSPRWRLLFALPAPPARPRTVLAGLALLCLLGRPQAAKAQDVMSLVRADRWAEADAVAAQYLDPVARKLVLFYRLLAPGAATCAEISQFMAENPDWPLQGLLAKRRDEALANVSDDAAARALCAQVKPRSPATMMRCAEANADGGKSQDAAALARQAWISGITDAQAETVFMRRWGKTLTAEDQWQRFVHLASSGSSAAGRQVARLDAGHRKAGQAWLAIRADDAKADKLYADLPESLRSEPLFVLDEARHLRRTGQDDAALALWRSSGDRAQHGVPEADLPAFWTERNALARRLLQTGDNKGAYDLVAAHGQTSPAMVADAEFLAGWIALRRLNDPATAARHFRKLADISQAAITQGRAHYWLGRAAEAAGDKATAAREYAAAAAWPTTYYGQLAALTAGQSAAALAAHIRALRDPGWDQQQALDFAGREVARAAALLVLWGEPARARAFLLRLEELAPDAADRALAARLALGLGLPDQAVMIARRAGVHGLMLPDAGWPDTVTPPAGPLDPATTLGVIRQESSFDVGAVSPAGARGLMQLMPATAKQVGQQIGEQVDPAELTVNADQNMRLGGTYLQGLLDQFGGALPLAIAAYNAGPSRVQQWIAQNGDPRDGQIGMIDWIELIPFNETRNYVQRVIENIEIYRARAEQAKPYPLAVSVQQAAASAPAADPR